MSEAAQELEHPLRNQAVALFKSTQNDICAALERFEPEARFCEDTWTREDAAPSPKASAPRSAFHGGGGRSRVLKGEVFEQAGVNFSEVFGTLPADMSAKLTGVAAEQSFYATGVSLVIQTIFLIG